MTHFNGTHKIDPLFGKRVVVLGFARQGKSLARWLPTVGAKAIISDTRTAEVLGAEMAPFRQSEIEFVLGGHPLNLLDQADVLCISGGVALDLPIVQEAQARGIPLTNDAQLFLERCPAPVIGITGSAGKTTTTSLTGAIMRQAGYTTHVGGNIGDVLLDVLPEIKPSDRVVMELSSFQLEIMTTSPHIATVLNITPNHLDRHGTMEAYTLAKAQIILHQAARDIAILCADDAGSRGLAEAVPGELAWFSAATMQADGAFMAGQRLLVSGLASSNREPRVVCDRSDIPLLGDHNVLNTLAACTLTGCAGVEPEAMAAAIRSFKAVAHRLESVRLLNGVTYVNDSIATAPERVQAALRSFSEPLVLLLGGKDKNLPWEEMLKLALRQSRHIITFGHAGPMIAEVLGKLGADPASFTTVQTLDAAVTRAAQVAQAGDVVLLSPGGTSYDAYKDFEQRGEHFRALVMGL
ncbi:MAG TPA: UDP-N-acetylmuramoyl-L-alanine--D-glutamate ligase [Aggregatilineales bacterium]|nr:UDP-N-acetylmuramoyl-L-alanine--D-glutamate ligase [Aggregatilineales bacterium]